MGPVKAALLTMGSIAFVAAGVLILTHGDADDSNLAWGVIAFFGACGLVGALQFLPRRRAIASGADELILQPGRLHFFGMAIGALAMGFGCLLLAPLAWADGDQFVSIVAYFGAAFFGLGGLAVVWRAVRLQPLARFDREGVHTFGVGAWTLSWREISEISVYEVQSQKFVIFKSHTRPPPLLSPMGFTVSAAGTGFAFEEVLAFANELWTRRRGP
jgi:hypothetical protein